MSDRKIRVGVLGASGYTGADLVRLAVRHPNVDVTVLTANSHAGKPIEEVFPHLRGLNLPALVTVEEANWAKVDAVFCGLPHGTTQQITNTVLKTHPHVKFIDMSADFRLRDADTYQQWYGIKHQAPELQSEAVYGLTEHYRDDIAKARLVACPGCYPTAVLTAMLPLAGAGLIDANEIIIDAKSGVSGAGRGLKQNTLFCEAGEGMSPYAVGTHRHAPEIEQEVSKVFGSDVIVNFTPHLIPMSRGELCTHYVRCAEGKTADDLREALAAFYANQSFVHVLKQGEMPATQHVRGSNNVLIAVFPDRIQGRAIVISALDNLIKGSAGQALQNFNLMFGLPEATGLEQVALFP
ncbi:N-acetyl-gamma-glutamyl-phosphate reductase [Pararhizobium sp. IMCC21322]|uniref:N-acetyl-gamma-glutamyl-phosphate reductase n=1 Tax=Pararhizobium sp. IMCC21322 TaxID=3067903 RepID=UPI002741EF7E|nr:N-acetyl-gamma-glutamyl-phosphate reductase [Pararhizobium sp. IMCC21322]